jgi:hypothetical protein
MKAERGSRFLFALVRPKPANINPALADCIFLGPNGAVQP